jgi:hypothetical protein
MEIVSETIHILAITTQPKAIVGTTMTSKLLACSFIYAQGNSTPTANKPVARTIRMTSSVMVFSKEPHERGAKMLAA